jgi:ABC-type amino acid transport substrate-binding protein
MNKMQGSFFVRTLGLSNLEALGIKDLPQKNYGFAVAEGNNKLRGILDEGILILKNRGKYDEIHEKWFGTQESKNSLREQGFVIFLSVSLLSLSSCLASSYGPGHCENR